MAPKRGLGKGLDALFLDNSTGGDSNAPEPVKISEIEPNRSQPRKTFDEESLRQLADSIRENGLIQPLAVRPLQSGGYQLIAGERRWRACRMAGLTEVPVLVLQIDDRKAMELAMIENLQREDLNPIEEALGYEQLMDSYQMTQNDISRVVGKSRPAVANVLRLLELPEALRILVQKGELSAGHARALLTVEDAEKQAALAARAVKEGLSVRDIERLAKDEKPSAAKPATHRDSYYTEMELAAKEELHRRIKVKEKDDKGVIEIEFFNREDFRTLIERLSDPNGSW